MREYEAVIGLEIHAQLLTGSKLFCGCKAAYGGEPNTRVCPVCLGLPGALPALNGRAVELAVRVGAALGCEIAPESTFDRKNYFYPDCPKNYQITQHDSPLCRGGRLVIAGGTRGIGILRVHIEEDAGKLIHSGGGYTFVDMNRSGVPLVEIVTAPDIRSPADASEALLNIRTILDYLDVCDGNMEEGSLRCDANVSIREKGSVAYGTQTEIKNLNSFKFVEQALAFEIRRQKNLLDSGARVEHETLLWNEREGTACVMRSKEKAHDYRYFPEPDLPVLKTPASVVEEIAAVLPELPAARERRFVDVYGLPAHDAGLLTRSRDLADYFEAAAEAAGDAKAAANWVMGEVLHEINERKINVRDFPVAPEDLGRLIGFLLSGRINTPTAKNVLREMLNSGEQADEIISRKSLQQITDRDVIAGFVKSVLDDNPAAVEKYLRGKDKLLQFFVGQIMKKGGGRVDPALAEELLRMLLEKRR